jgi:hypothetical protein
MDSPERGALMLVRFIAVALIGWTGVNFGLDLASHHFHPQTYPELKWLGCIENSVPALLGLILLIKSRAVAEWISDKLDE